MQNQMTVRCSNCGQPFNTEVHTIVDVVQNPQLKMSLLTGRLNSGQCPSCGTVNVMAAPLLYHDPSKELLIAMVPMELNLPKDEQEKIIGEMMNRLPKENFKAYMFSPKRALTMQGLIDQILEADGVTPEMMKAQRDRVKLAQTFIEAEEDQLPALVKEHDAEIDEQFFQAITILAQRAMEEGRQDIAQGIIYRQNQIASLSSVGQALIAEQESQQRVIESVAERLRELGENASREDFIQLAIEYADDDAALEALVGLARPAFDYELLQMLTIEISKAPADQREKIGEVRNKILDLTAAIDQQTQATMQNAAGFLQAIINDENPEELVRENAHMIDDTFMAVLSSNIQYAEQQKNVQASARLKEVYNLVVNILKESMEPELRFINDLLSTESYEKAVELIQQDAPAYGEKLLEMMEAVGQMLDAQGNQELVQKLDSLRDEITAAIRA